MSTCENAGLVKMLERHVEVYATQVKHLEARVRLLEANNVDLVAQIEELKRAGKPG